MTYNPATHLRTFMIPLLLTGVLLSLMGCGGATGDLGNVSANLSADIAGNGIFRDSNVSGLKYVTPTKTGITGTDGVFDYQQNEIVTFSIGGVTLGGAKGNSVMTPVDFSTVESSDSLTSKNIGRFLLMLDHDGDPTNGIEITQAVQTIAASWSQVDFTTADLDTALTNIISDVNSVDSPPTHVLPDDATAKTHLDTTLLCTYGGAFQGQSAGDDSGQFAFVVEANPNRPSAGLLNGYLFSAAQQRILTVSGISPMTFDNATNFATVNASASDGRNIIMRYTTLDQIDGNWSQAAGTGFGTFSGGRLGGGQAGQWYFTGTYTPDAAHPEWDSGILAFNVLGTDTDSIAGDVYSMNTATQYGLSGNLAGGNNISDATSSADGKRWSGIAVINDPTSIAYGVMSGTWTDVSKGQSGNFTGTGCKRN